MKSYHALKSFNENSSFGSSDVLVLFGELFQRGYANGLVEEAKRRGMTIIYSTVGRREKAHEVGENSLRPLSPQEVTNMPSPLVNIPLEAGFDLEPAENGLTPVDQLSDLKLNNWDEFQLDRKALHQSMEKGRIRFRQNVRLYLQEVEKRIPRGATRVLFAHLMAGGIPRAKIVLPLMNRALKGRGTRYLESKTLWSSGIGELCQTSFNEVTANTFDVLIQESTALREKIEGQGGKVAYSAYGYHGTEVLMDGVNYVWQTYTPYIQGWAKVQLENISRRWSHQGVACSVYNCPEISTSSSGIFQGVELSLYPLLSALRKESGDSEKTKAFLSKCQLYLKPSISISDLVALASEYLRNPLIRNHCLFDQWPQHSSREQLEFMLAASDRLYDCVQDLENSLTAELSEAVFSLAGKIMLNDIARPESAVSWINHDILAKVYPSLE